MSKGSKQRPTDKASYDANYDAIFKRDPVMDKLLDLIEEYKPIFEEADYLIAKLKGEIRHVLPVASIQPDGHWANMNDAQYAIARSMYAEALSHFRLETFEEWKKRKEAE